MHAVFNKTKSNIQQKVMKILRRNEEFISKDKTEKLDSFIRKRTAQRQDCFQKWFIRASVREKKKS